MYVFQTTLLCRDQAMAALNKGREELEILRRQSLIGNLYPSAKSVMEKA